MASCDICNAEIAGDSNNRLSQSHFCTVVQNGFNPFNENIHNAQGLELSEVGLALGLSLEEQYSRWKAQALADVSDWLLCEKCYHIASRYLIRGSSSNNSPAAISAGGINNHVTESIERKKIATELLTKKDADTIDTLSKVMRGEGEWQYKEVKDISRKYKAEMACIDFLHSQMEDNPKKARVIITRFNNDKALTKVFQIMHLEAVRRLFRYETSISDRFFDWISGRNEHERLVEVYNLIQDLIDLPEQNEAVDIVCAKLGGRRQVLFELRLKVERQILEQFTSGNTGVCEKCGAKVGINYGDAYHTICSKCA